MKRRDFIQSLGASSMAIAAAFGGLPLLGCSEQTANRAGKREAMLELIHGTGKQNYYPGAFFVHFPVEDHFGPTAVSRHMEFFRFTGSDLLKIQYERKFPLIESLQKPSDWVNVPLLKKDFYEEQLKVIEGVVKEGKREALIIPTVYSPLSFAGHFTGYKHHIDHLNEDPEAVKKGMEIITESTLIFVRECAKLGVDGFFQATQGGEAGRFEYDQIFQDYIKPFDLVVAEEIAEKGECNILHIHNGSDGYADYSEFVDYPCHVVNCGLNLKDSAMTTRDLYKQFGKPIMGGFDRDGIIYHGTKEDIAAEATRILSEAPNKFILSATCTVPRDTDWANIRTALDTAHDFI